MRPSSYTILRENVDLLALIGEGCRQEGCCYRGSRFNFFAKTSEGTLVYNTLTNAFLLVDERLAPHLRNENLTQSGDNTFAGDLIRLRLMVPDGEDELAFYRQCHSLLLQLRNLRHGGVRYNIYTTTACNARCFYCFEEGIAQEHMSLETAKAVADYIVRTHSPTEEVHFRWFGGEPLLNPEAISTICDHCRAEGVHFYSTMSTNGWLLDERMLQTAQANWLLAKVRFSFDGTRDEHNRRKRFVSQGDGFSRTLENLRRTVDANIHVLIRLTLDMENADSLLTLAKEFVAEFRDNPHVTMYAKCIGQETAKKAFQRDPSRVLQTLKAQDELNSFLLSKGKYDLERIMPAGMRIDNCTANDPRKVVVSPTGRLSSCECFCIPENQWGDVWNGITDVNIWRRWTTPNLIRAKCVECPLLPVCTPFAADCPWDLFDCRTRFMPTMELFMRENYRRYQAGIPMLPDTEDYSCFKFQNFEGRIWPERR